MAEIWPFVSRWLSCGKKENDVLLTLMFVCICWYDVADVKWMCKHGLSLPCDFSSTLLTIAFVKVIDGDGIFTIENILVYPMVLLNLLFESGRLESPSASNPCGKNINIPPILYSKIPIVAKYLENKNLG